MFDAPLRGKPHAALHGRRAFCAGGHRAGDVLRRLSQILQQQAELMKLSGSTPLIVMFVRPGDDADPKCMADWMQAFTLINLAPPLCD